MYDVLILVTEKDFVKLKYCVDAIRRNLEGFNKIYCVSDVPVMDVVPGLEYFLDRDVVNFNFASLTGDPGQHKGWYRQQFIKLFQNVTSDDYLVVDSDVIINRKLVVEESNKPCFLLGNDQCHGYYFDLMKKVFDLDKVYPHSFICEVMYMKRAIVQEMLHTYSVDKYSFFDKVVAELNFRNYSPAFSEYEFYGNFVTKYFPGSYMYKHVVSCFGAKFELWKESDIIEYLNSLKNSEYDLITLHSWI
jgi:hypothetical protein